jgi:predicted Zn finger-like uncharacterized protein
MRLTCPNCGVEYEVPDGMVPAAGRHVQCTACHTRWFVRGVRSAATEDQILSRLETWRPRPAAVPAPAAGPTLVPDPPAPDEPAPSAEPEPEVVLLEETAEVVLPEPEPEPEPEATPDPEPAPETPAPALRAAPEKPGDQPSVSLPAPLSDSALAPVRRLDLGSERPSPLPPAPPPSRFGRGFILATVLALLALGAYLYRAPIVEQVPAAAPALERYAGYVDAARDEVDRQYHALRERIGD